jgi:hypothetical protein
MAPNPSKNPAAQDFIAALAVAHAEAKLALDKTAEHMKRFADRKRRPTPELKVGDKVYLDMRNIKTERPSKKLDARRTGPFTILEKVSPVAYRVELPLDWTIHPVFHVSLLRQAHIDETLHPDPVNDSLRPPPDIIDDQEEYEVEQVLDHRRKGAKREYLIKWRGYPESESTWESKASLKHAQNVVKAYKRTIKQ